MENTAHRTITEGTSSPVASISVHYGGTDGWTITADKPLTDEQAMAISWRATPAQVRLGSFVEVDDPEGKRIGHVATAVYRERHDGPAYVVCTLNLR